MAVLLQAAIAEMQASKKAGRGATEAKSTTGGPKQGLE